VPFKVVPSTGVTPFPHLFHCYYASWNTLSEMMHNFYHIFLNLLYALERMSFQGGFKFGKKEKCLLGLSPDNRVDGAQWMSDVLPDNCR
jgi:hypothetical protein